MTNRKNGAYSLAVCAMQKHAPTPAGRRPATRGRRLLGDKTEPGTGLGLLASFGNQGLPRCFGKRFNLNAKSISVTSPGLTCWESRSEMIGVHFGSIMRTRFLERAPCSFQSICPPHLGNSWYELQRYDSHSIITGD